MIYTTIVEKNKILISNLNFHWHILRPFPRWRKWSGLFFWKKISPSDISLQLLHSEVLKALSTSPQTDTDVVPHFPHLTPGWICWLPLKADAPTYELTPKQSTSKLWHDHHIPSSLKCTHLCRSAEQLKDIYFHRLIFASPPCSCFLLPQETGGRCPPGAAKPQHHQSLPTNLTSKRSSDQWHELPLQWNIKSWASKPSSDACKILIRKAKFLDTL